MKTLYNFHTVGLGNYWIVAESLNEAKDALKDKLDKADYGFTSKREVVSVDILTNIVDDDHKGIPDFRDANRLIICSS